MNSLSLSTSWNAFRCDSGVDIVREIISLGFKKIELSFNLTGIIVDQIVELAQAKKVEVTSVHNYCPFPDGITRQAALPDCFSIASLDDQQRTTAVEYTKRSIDSAQRLGGRAVVIHAGRLEIEDKTKQLIALYDHGLQDTVQYAKLKDTAIQARAACAKEYLSQAKKSIEDLSGYAKSQGVAIGIETRYYYREIPSFEELAILFEHFDDDNIFYWHDVGHAQLWENLGFISHEDYLKRYADRMLGIHLHDIRRGKDHLAPLLGEFDFKRLLGYVKPHTIKVMEAHAPATADDIVNAKKYIESLLCN
ncbi:sugar phosphate isomerase/epimerase family protein [Candidatus Omnitrophota bacterium]